MFGECCFAVIRYLRVVGRISNYCPTLFQLSSLTTVLAAAGSVGCRLNKCSLVVVNQSFSRSCEFQPLRSSFAAELFPMRSLVSRHRENESFPSDVLVICSNSDIHCRNGLVVYWQTAALFMLSPTINRWRHPVSGCLRPCVIVH